MATTYTIIYTYTGQSTWTSARRVVNFSNFVASGDTDKTIAQIKSIKFERWHGTSSRHTYSFSAQLVDSSGNVFTSDTVEQLVSSSSHSKVTNTFNTLPTVSQFNNLTTIRFLSGTSYEPTEHPTLYWAARSANPMKIIVTFTDEPPWVYHPQILDFQVKRGTDTGGTSDSGKKALLTIKLSLDDYTATESIVLGYYQGNSTTLLGSVVLTSYLSDLISGKTNYYGYVTDDFSTDLDYRFVLQFTAGTESVSAAAWLSNSFCSLHIAPYSTGGVSIGDLSTASEGNPKFEVHHPSYFHKPSYFYDGIANIQAGVVNELGVTAGGEYKDGAVTFSQPYASGTTPVVTISFMSVSTAANFGKCSVAVMSVSNTGFTFRFFNGDTSNRNPKFVYTSYAVPGDNIGSSGGGGTGEGGSGDGGEGTTILPVPATRNALGLVMPGTGLNIGTDGVLSISASYDTATYATSQIYQGLIRFGSDSGYQLELPIPLPPTAKLRTGDYGDTLPTSNLYNGRLFFLKKT